MKKGWAIDPNWISLKLQKDNAKEQDKAHREMIENQRRMVDDQAAMRKIAEDDLRERRLHRDQCHADQVASGKIQPDTKQ